METEAIAEVLGGRKVFGRSIKNPGELAHLIRAACRPVLFRRSHNGFIWSRVFFRENWHFTANVDSQTEPWIPVDVFRIGSYRQNGTSIRQRR